MTFIFFVQGWRTHFLAIFLPSNCPLQTFPAHLAVASSNTSKQWNFCIEKSVDSQNLDKFFYITQATETFFPWFLLNFLSSTCFSLPLMAWWLQKPRCAILCTCITQLGRILLPNYQGSIINNLIAGNREARVDSWIVSQTVQIAKTKACQGFQKLLCPGLQ